MAELAKKRPKFLNLFAIRLPIAGFASILHRISGFGLFLVLPVLIWMLDMSLRSPEGYQALLEHLGHPVTKLILIGVTWAFLHHFFMGIRILLIDVHVGVAKNQARSSAIAVLAISLVLTLILGANLW